MVPFPSNPDETNGDGPEPDSSKAPPHPLNAAVAMSILILPVMLAGWVLSFSPFEDLVSRDGKPFLADFICFYIAGECVSENELDRLYDDNWAHDRSSQLVPKLSEGMNLPFRYPPLFAAIASPLSWVSFPVACVLFLILQFGCIIGAVLWWRRDLPELQQVGKKTLLLACIGFPLTMESLMGGQLSPFTLLILSSTILLLRRNKSVAAGAVLGLVMLKPNVALLFILGVLLRYPKALLGLILSGCVMLGATLFSTGTQTLQTYIQLGTELASRPWQTGAPVWKVHGLQPYVEMIVGQHSKLITLLLGVACILATVFFWRQNKLSSADGFSLLLIINGLFGMYVPIYDLLLFLPVLFLQADELSRRENSETGQQWQLTTRESLPAFALLITLGPHLSQSLMVQTGIQLYSLVLLMAVVWTGVGTSRQTESTADQTLPFSLQSR